MDSSYSLPIFFSVASLALGQWYDCPSASEVTLKGMGKITWYLTHHSMQPCAYFWGILYVYGVILKLQEYMQLEYTWSSQ